jgi:DnaJ homolog subfamily C member 11
LAYRKQCILYHPDKHTGVTAKEAAQRKFELIHKAFEVLSDPVLRLLYDLYGERGLAENLQLIPRDRSPEEIRRGYEKRHFEAEELKRRVQTNARSHIKATIDMSPLFIRDPYMKEAMARQPIGLAALLIDLNRVFIIQSVEFPIGRQDRLVLAGSVESANGIGMPRLTATYQKQLGGTSLGQLQVGLGTARYANVAITKHFGSKLFTQLAGTIGQTHEASIFGCIFTVGRYLTKNTVATLSWKEGTTSGLQLNVETVRHDSNFTTSFQLNESLGLAVEVKYGHQTSKKTRLKVGLDCSLNPGISFGAERKLNKYTYIGSTWHWTYFQGIRLTFK